MWNINFFYKSGFGLRERKNETGDAVIRVFQNKMHSNMHNLMSIAVIHSQYLCFTFFPFTPRPT